MSGQPEQANGAINWSSRSLASRWKHRVFYSLIRCFGIKPAKILLFFVVIFYTLRPDIYRRSLFYLKRRFGEASFWRRYRQVFRLYWTFGQVLVERAAGGILGNINIASRDEDTARLLEFLASGRGVILLNSHVGFWQLGMVGLPENLDINVIFHREEGDVDKHHFEHDYGTGGIRFIDPDKLSFGSMEFASALVRGEIVCFLGDRVAPNDKLRVRAEFLGGDILVPGAPFLMASITGAPIMVSMVHRVGPVKGLSLVYKVIKVPPKLPRTEEAIRPYARMYTEALEEFAQKYPYQFFNIFDMWTF